LNDFIKSENLSLILYLYEPNIHFEIVEKQDEEEWDESDQKTLQKITENFDDLTSALIPIKTT
jgi:hypothetical protein